MPRRKLLTDAGVNTLTPRQYPDPELPGHYIRSRPSGIKAVARAPSGKQVWHTIGPSSLYTIADARERARTAIRTIREGRGARAIRVRS
jgi:hypothetical protein